MHNIFKKYNYDTVNNNTSYLEESNNIADRNRLLSLNTQTSDIGPIKSQVNQIWDAPCPQFLMVLNIDNNNSSSIFPVSVKEITNVSKIELLEIGIRFSADQPSDAEQNLLFNLDIDNTKGLINTISNTVSPHMHPIYINHNFVSPIYYYEFNTPRLIKAFKEGDGKISSMKLQITDGLGKPYKFTNLKLYFKVYCRHW